MGQAQSRVNTQQISEEKKKGLIAKLREHWKDEKTMIDSTLLSERIIQQFESTSPNDRLIADIDYLIRACGALLKNKMLSPANFSMLITRADYTGFDFVSLSHSVAQFQKMDILNQTNFDALVACAQSKKTYQVLYVVNSLSNQGILNQSNFDILLKNIPCIELFFEIINNRNIAHIVDQEIFDAVIANIQELDKLPKILSLMFLTKETIIRLVKVAKHAPALAECILKINDNESYLSKSIISDWQQGFIEKQQEFIDARMKRDTANDNLLITNAARIDEHLVQLANGFEVLHSGKIPTQDTVILTLMLENAPYAETLALGFVALKKAGLLNEHNREALVINVQHSGALSYGFRVLQDVNVDILNQEYVDLLLRHPANASRLALGFVELKKAGLLTKDNCNALVSNVEYSAALLGGFYALQDVNVKILNQEYVDLLLRHPANASALGSGFGQLKIAGLLNEDNRDALVRNVQQSTIINNGLFIFKALKALNQENFDLLIEKVTTSPETVEPWLQALEDTAQQAFASSSTQAAGRKTVLFSDGATGGQSTTTGGGPSKEIGTAAAQQKPK